MEVIFVRKKILQKLLQNLIKETVETVFITGIQYISSKIKEKKIKSENHEKNDKKE
jgi:hypothetical protein